MKFNIFSELEYQVISPTIFIFNVQAAKSPGQMIYEESLYTDPPLLPEEFTLNNTEVRFIRFEVNEPMFFTITYKATVDVKYKIIDETRLSQTIPLIKLNQSVIPFLFPSRYCQNDKLLKLAMHEFGSIQNTYEKVTAISDWIYNSVEYLSGTTNSCTSAYDTLTQREGVCRDFAHVGIALCRALDIPARYFTGYAYNLNPPDFHACFEAYIGGEWIFFDPTKLVPVNGLVKIANGRDAADAAVASFFGNSICTKMNVQCNAAENFIPYIQVPGKLEGLSYT